MSDKTSQTTEEELLDQTFGPLEEGLGDDPETIDKELKEKGKKKNSNMLIYAAGGVVAVSLVGYVLLGGQEQQVPQQPVAPVSSITPPVTASSPVASPTYTEPVQNESFLANQNLAGNPLAGERLNEEMINNPNISNNVFGQQAPVQPAMPVEQNMPDFMSDLQKNQPQQAYVPPAQQDNGTFYQPNSPVFPVNPGSTTNEISGNVMGQDNSPTRTPSYENNLVQTELVQQLQQMFEKQTSEIKGSIDEINTSVVDVTKRVEVLENKLDKTSEEQKEINKSLDERLAKLESGLQTKELAKVEDKKATPAKPVVKKAAPAPKKATPKKATPTKTEVLVDKSKVQARKAPARATGGTKIHSIFAGRVWTRNADGSLSTFVAGERLNGEVIKSVEMDSIIMESGRVIK